MLLELNRYFHNCVSHSSSSATRQGSVLTQLVSAVVQKIFALWSSSHSQVWRKRVIILKASPQGVQTNEERISHAKAEWPDVCKKHPTLGQFAEITKALWAQDLIDRSHSANPADRESAKEVLEAKPEQAALDKATQKFTAASDALIQAEKEHKQNKNTLLWAPREIKAVEVGVTQTKNKLDKAQEAQELAKLKVEQSTAQNQEAEEALQKAIHTINPEATGNTQAHEIGAVLLSKQQAAGALLTQSQNILSKAKSTHQAVVEHWGKQPGRTGAPEEQAEQQIQKSAQELKNARTAVRESQNGLDKCKATHQDLKDAQTRLQETRGELETNKNTLIGAESAFKSAKSNHQKSIEDQKTAEQHMPEVQERHLSSEKNVVLYKENLEQAKTKQRMAQDAFEARQCVNLGDNLMLRFDKKTNRFFVDLRVLNRTLSVQDFINHAEDLCNPQVPLEMRDGLALHWNNLSISDLKDSAKNLRQLVGKALDKIDEQLGDHRNYRKQDPHWKLQKVMDRLFRTSPRESTHELQSHIAATRKKLLGSSTKN